MNNLRYVIINEEKKSFKDIKKDDIFDLYEPDNVFIGRYKALDNVYLNENNIFTILVDELSSRLISGNPGEFHQM